MSIKTVHRPLVTFALFGFNQERFIEEAVHGTFAQDYSPLQIILSDDGSQDGTFAIMQRLARAYSGPHTVQITRNPCKSSIGAHVNHVMNLASGELIVGAAGDDISLPERTSTIYKAWEQNGFTSSSIHSAVEEIDENGQLLPQAMLQYLRSEECPTVTHRPDIRTFIRTRRPLIIGASHAWSRDLFDKFGPLLPHLLIEDAAIGFRSALHGFHSYVDRPLVKYRRHGGNLFASIRSADQTIEDFTATEKRRRDRLHHYVVLYDSFKADLDHALKLGLLDVGMLRELKQEILKTQLEFQEGLTLLNGRFGCRLAVLVRRLLQEGSRQEFGKSIPFLFGPRLRIPLRMWTRRLRARTPSADDPTAGCADS